MSGGGPPLKIHETRGNLIPQALFGCAPARSRSELAGSPPDRLTRRINDVDEEDSDEEPDQRDAALPTISSYCWRPGAQLSADGEHGGDGAMLVPALGMGRSSYRGDCGQRTCGRCSVHSRGASWPTETVGFPGDVGGAVHRHARRREDPVESLTGPGQLSISAVSHPRHSARHADPQRRPR